MKIRLVAAFVVALVAIGVVAFPVHASAAPSAALRTVLTTLRNLSDQDFDKVLVWARNGTPRPTMSMIFADQKAEADILALGQADRAAVLQWLRGNGRSALYDRGATDAQIGNRRPASGPVSTPTPNPWRALEFGSPTVGGAPIGNIVVTGGWAAVKRDGRGAAACISFKNTGPREATRVLMEIPIVDDAGTQLAALPLDRHGTFSSGIDINGWSDASGWQAGVGHRGFNDNCTSISTAVPALPLLAARFATYHLLRVEYADGTFWTPAEGSGATPLPRRR